MPAINEQMREFLQLPGARSVSLVDYTNDRVLAEFGHGIRGGSDGTDGVAALVRAFVADLDLVSREDGNDLEDVVLTTSGGYLLVAVLSLPTGTRFCIQLRMDRESGNVGLALRALRHFAARPPAGLAEAFSPPPGPPQRRTRALPRRYRDPTRRLRAGGQPVDWETPDPATLRRVLGALRELCSAPVEPPLRGLRTGAA
ncbi:hypothetical protein ACQEU5_13725 [Marinactinospora thermotolerans]|uniref:hypothetical protein n=1 Tax=Marinactinospora thermotolerans TaxID=531310 RepID=UPI003D8EF9E1